MRRAWNEAHIAVRIAARKVVRTDHEQARVLALRASVGLQRNRRKAGHRLQPFLQPRKHFRVTLRLVRRRKGMQARKARPRNGRHLRRRIQLHGAAAQRDHCGCERKIFRLQAVDVAQQFRFRVIAGEHRMLHKFGGALQFGWECCRFAGGCLVQVCSATAKRLHHLLQVRIGDRFVQRNAHAAIAKVAQVHTVRARRRQHLGNSPQMRAHTQRVKEVCCMQLASHCLQRCRQVCSLRVNTGGNALKSLRAVVNSVHGRSHSQQHLRRAQVAGGLLAPDVLLACLQCQPHGGLPVGIARDTNNAARQVALVILARGHECRMRPAKAQRYAQALRAAHSHIRAPLSRRL